MANKTITQLPEVTTAQSTDVIPIVANNITSKIAYSNLVTSTNVAYDLELEAHSFSDQTIGASDTLQQIRFGSSQTGSHLSLSGTGVITPLTAGSYLVDAYFTLARTGAAGGVSSLVIQANFGSDQIIPSAMQKLNSASEIRNFNTSFVWNVSQANVTASDGLVFNLFRDSGTSSGNGASEGGLYDFSITASGVDPVRSSYIKIHRLVS